MTASNLSLSAGFMKQIRKYLLSRNGKDEQFRIIRFFRMALSKRMSASTFSFVMRHRKENVGIDVLFCYAA